MSIGYHFAENVIIIEFSLVALIVLTTLFLKFYYYLAGRRKKRITIEIEHYLNRIILARKEFKSHDFAKKWRNLGILLQILIIFYKNNIANHWQDIRSDFIKTIILPLAKKAAFSRRWQSRYYAARAFELVPEKGNDKLIEKLVNDPVPLVNLYAGKAALVNHSDSAINSMITRIASEGWQSQSFNLHTFDSALENKRIIFEKKLETAKKPDVRAVCYEIMLRYPPTPIKLDMTSDIHSDNTKLKIAAIKFVSHVDRDKAIPYLIELLNDPHWEVRLIALHRLSMLNAKQAIPQIVVCLKDPDWWVKISAAEALKMMGEEGERALQSQNLALDKISFNLTHLLNTWW